MLYSVSVSTAYLKRGFKGESLSGRRIVKMEHRKGPSGCLPGASQDGRSRVLLLLGEHHMQHNSIGEAMAGKL